MKIDVPLDYFELEILIKALATHEAKCELTKDRYNFDIALGLEYKLKSALKRMIPPKFNDLIE